MKPSTSTLALVNGQPSACVSLFDRGLAYGDGLFETLRIHAGKPVLAGLHWDRLQLGLERLAIPLALGEVQQQLQQLLRLALSAGRSSGVVKLMVTRGDGFRGFAPPLEPQPSVLLCWQELPLIEPRQPLQGRRLLSCRQRLPYRPWLAGLKHLNCLEYVLARMELTPGADLDGLLMDCDGRVIEATTSNLFVVMGGALVTPALHRCGIMGTVRRWIIEEQAGELHLPLVEADLLPEEIHRADEVFICNSVIGISPVSRIDQWCWQPGPVTEAISSRFARMLDESD